MTVGNYAALLDRAKVLKATADKVRALYDEVSRLPTPTGYGPTRVRNLAKAQGWFPPVAWDDDTIDNPATTPALIPPVDGSNPDVDEWAIQHVYAGHIAAKLDTGAKRELARRLAFNGWTRPRIGDLLGVTASRVVDLIGGKR
jgi:hypothetical protein